MSAPLAVGIALFIAWTILPSRAPRSVPLMWWRCPLRLTGWSSFGALPEAIR